MASVTLGKYRLIAELGRGGMAEVFLAVTSTPSMLSFAKLVVIKKPRAHLAEDAEFIAMFVDEARIAARLNHPNLVQTLEVGEVDGQYFLTMEYLDGQPLHRVLSRARDELPLDMHIGVLIDVLAGIHHAHELKDYDGTPLRVVHRDVTPHNVFITYDGTVKVVDFGIAKAVGRAAETRHGIVKGKMAYMAPEQASGREIDRRVDIFTVGIMLFEAITRRRMWRGLDEMEIVRRLVEGKIPSSPRAVDPTVDEELDRICQRALAARPADRYETAAAFQRDLEKYLSSGGRSRPSGREIGEYVSGKFADKRQMINTIIEKQLAQMRKEQSEVKGPASVGDKSLPNIAAAHSTTGSQEHYVVPGEPVGSSPPSSSAVLTSAVTERRPIPTQPEVAPQAVNNQVRPSVEPPLPRANNAGGSPILIGAVVALAVAGIATAFVALQRTPVAPPPPPPAPSAEALLTVTLRATPLETKFQIDDGAPLENPYIGKFPKDDKKHHIRAHAAGYVDRDEIVDFGGDVSFRFTLAREKATPTAHDK
jgi:eukaryotic-like serine/threonine-protein kinase